MNLAILQLSDIHISSRENSALGRARLIKAAIQPSIPDDCAVLVTYNGDIAFSGQKQEYDFAEQFLQEITNNLELIPGLHILGTVIVPGNHDCDFTLAGDARPTLLSSVASNLTSIDLNGESVAQLLKVQKNFFEFEQKFSKCPRASIKEQIGWTSAHAHGKRRVLVRCLNTALFSRLREAPGQLYFPLHAIPDQDDEADFAITIFHHPYGWLNPDNSRELHKQLELISDVILTGHEHDGDTYTRLSRSGEETNYVEGAALGAANETGFNLIVVNLAASTNQIFQYSWQEGLYVPGKSDARIFTRKQSLIASRFENNAEFVKNLNDVGAGFFHPDKQLNLRDLFVYPELKVASISLKTQSSIQSWKVLPFVEGRDLLQIAGAPTSGKSTLARALYLDLQREYSLVPILLNGRSLRSSSNNEFEKTVEEAFRDQYSSTLFERFRQLDVQRRVVLIDDWHRSPLSNKAKRKILEAARARFGRVILFADDVSLFQLLADIGKDATVSETEYCEIKQFGFRLRSELIRKWHSVGSDLDMDDMELTAKISSSENLLDTLVRKGVVPSWPIFILSVLQANSLAVQETASYGSYGHLYEALLTKRMANTGKRRSLLGLKYTYLSLVAYELFRLNREVLNEMELRSVHNIYEREYHVSLDAGELWEEFASAQVLVRSGDEFRFQYKYAYYFFVAKYFQQGIGNAQEAPSLRAILSYMVRCVHDEDCANILVFYIYLTKDREVIEQMLWVAKQIYSDKRPSHLTTDVEFVNKLRSKSSQVLIERTNIGKNREEYRSKMDAAESEEGAPNHPLAKTEYQDGIPDALKIEFAFKSLQVMGQVVKNFPLDLKGDLKLELTKQSYELTLRTLGVFLNIIELNMMELVSVFEKALRVLQPFAKKNDEEIREASHATIVRLTELAIFGMIKRLSLAIGVVDLKETYHKIRETVGEEDVPTRLIDLSLKLDHFGHIPESDVKDLEHRLKGNITAYTILKLLIADFLYLFPCDYKTEQRMVEIFKFKPHILNLGEKKVKKLPG
jgi:calcineurin-like phosphoesterase family protein